MLSRNKSRQDLSKARLLVTYGTAWIYTSGSISRIADMIHALLCFVVARYQQHWYQRYVSRTWICNHIPKYSMGCTYPCLRYLLLAPKSSYQWVSARKAQLQCVSNGVTSFLHQPIDIFFRIAWLALGQSYDCPSGSEATLKDMDIQITLIHLKLII